MSKKAQKVLAHVRITTSYNFYSSEDPQIFTFVQILEYALDIKHSKWPIFFPSRQNFQKGPIIFNWVCSCKHIIKFVL